MPPIELTQEQLEEKLCPRAGVEVISGTTSLGRKFVYVDSTRNLAHGVNEDPECDVITRFILGEDRDQVLAIRKTLGPPEPIPQPNSTCRVGFGPVLMLREDGSTELVDGAEALTLMVPAVIGITVDSMELKAPENVAFAEEATNFNSTLKKTFDSFVEKCPGSRS